MLRNQLINSIRKIPTRAVTSARENYLDLAIDNDGIAVMNWQKRPVNSYNLEFLQAINGSLDELTKNEKFKGLVMTSKVFSTTLANIYETYMILNADPNLLFNAGEFMKKEQQLFNDNQIVYCNQSTGLVITGNSLLGTCQLIRPWAMKGIPKVFSGGVDLLELNKPDPERLRTLWRTMQELFLKMYGLEAITTVAINGHAAAGACVVSLMCDYRVMVNDKSKIGMNDTAVGIVPSWWICEIMNRAMGYRQAEIAITTSKMYSPEEALKVQMVDELAIDKEDAVEKCKKFIRLHENIPKSSVKKHLRGSVIRYVEKNREKDVETVLNSILNPYTQKKIAKYVAQLKKRTENEPV